MMREQAGRARDIDEERGESHACGQPAVTQPPLGKARQRWLVGMTYKAVRTDRHKYIHWVNKSREHELDELYDLDTDPFEQRNLNRSRSHAGVRAPPRVGVARGRGAGHLELHRGVARGVAARARYSLNVAQTV